MTDGALAGGRRAGRLGVVFPGLYPCADFGRLQQAARQNAWGLLAQGPTTEDVPTKLKEQSVLEPDLPGDRLSGHRAGVFLKLIFPAGFYCSLLVFFGIIFGDGGYGSFDMRYCSGSHRQGAGLEKAVPPAIVLVWLFGLSTVVWGTVTCSWFGMPAEQVPQWLVNLSVPVFSNAYSGQLWYPFGPGGAGLTTSQNLQIFCLRWRWFSLPLRMSNAPWNRHSLKLLGDIGLALELFGIYYVVLSLVVSSAVFPLGLVLGGFPVGTAAIVLVAVGFVLNFVFSNYEGSIAGSVKSKPDQHQFRAAGRCQRLFRHCLLHPPFGRWALRARPSRQR